MYPFAKAFLLPALVFSSQAIAQCPPRPGAPPNWCRPVMRPQVPAMPRGPTTNNMGPQSNVPMAPNYNTVATPNYGNSVSSPPSTYSAPRTYYGASPTAPSANNDPQPSPGYTPAPPRPPGYYDPQSNYAQQTYRYTCEINDEEDDAGDLCDVYSRYPAQRGDRCRCDGERGTIQ